MAFAVHILKSGELGPVIEVHVASGGGALAGNYYFADGTLGEPIAPPPGFNYDLWLNGAQYEPCRPNMVQRRWRSWWNYGGGQIADWVVHLTDVLFYAFPELQSPTVKFSRATIGASLKISRSERIGSLKRMGIALDSLVEGLFRFVIAALATVDSTQPVVGVPQLRVQFYGLS